jgi:hypothetical protein
MSEPTRSSTGGEVSHAAAVYLILQANFTILSPLMEQSTGSWTCCAANTKFKDPYTEPLYMLCVDSSGVHPKPIE